MGGEVSESDINAKKVWWNDRLEDVEMDLVSLLQTQAEEDPEYETRVGGEGPQTPAGKWLAENGKIGLRLESQNSLEPKNVYLEMRNKARRDSWGIGLREDSNFLLWLWHVGIIWHGIQNQRYESIAQQRCDIYERCDIQ